MTIQTVTAGEARRLLSDGATFIDIRPADEHAREKISGGRNVPLDSLRPDALPDGAIIFHCRSGMRTEANAPRLADAAGERPCYILEGGIDGWRRAGQATIADRSQPLELMRQVQLAAGGLVLLGVLLGFVVAPAFFVLAGFVGGGLMMAGATGWCGMATLLRAMPWNRSASAS